MSQLVIDIPDERRAFFEELLRSLHVSFRPMAPKGPQTPAEQEWVDEMTDALREARRAERGEAELQDAREFLREL